VAARRRKKKADGKWTVATYIEPFTLDIIGSVPHAQIVGNPSGGTHASPSDYTTTSSANKSASTKSSAAKKAAAEKAVSCRANRKVVTTDRIADGIISDSLTAGCC
jgi:hypothetical protein